MAIPVNISDLIKRRIVESNRIEYKADFNPTPILHTICAFANDIDNMGGGYLVIGVEEENGVPKFPVRGICREAIDGILKRLHNLCHFIEPLYQPVVEPVMYEGAHLIVVWIFGGFGRPYKASKDATVKQSVKEYYIRKFSSSVVASPDEEKELFYISSSIPFDDRPNLAASVNDLDLGLLRSHLRETESDLYRYSEDKTTLELARDMQLLDGPAENEKPRNVALLMFSEHPETYFRYARIEIVDLPDPTGAGMTEMSFSGPIQRQLRDALAWLKNYVLRETTFKLPDRAEAVRIANYPYAAIEEVLANAVYHRSYQIPEPIVVRITPESIEVTSHPGFDRSITEDNIKKYHIRARTYRNRRIGDFLKELKLIEGRNTGFPNALSALRANGSPLLRFEMPPGREWLSVTIPIHPAFLPQKQKNDKVTAYEEKITALLTSQPMTLTELSHAMGYKGITAKMRKSVEKLLAQGTLKRQAASDGAVKLTTK